MTNYHEKQENVRWDWKKYNYLTMATLYIMWKTSVTNNNIVMVWYDINTFFLENTVSKNNYHYIHCIYGFSTTNNGTSPICVSMASSAMQLAWALNHQW